MKLHEDRMARMEEDRKNGSVLTRKWYKELLSLLGDEIYEIHDDESEVKRVLIHTTVAHLADRMRTNRYGDKIRATKMRKAMREMTELYAMNTEITARIETGPENRYVPIK